MTAPDSAAPRATFLDALSVYLKPRVLIVLFLGFSSGLPLALSGGTLLVWLRESGLDLGIIGLFTLAGTPYTVKFLWAPLTDALDGRYCRLARTTARLAGVLANFADRRDPVARPVRSDALCRPVVLSAAIMVAAASATQERGRRFPVESLPENEQAAGMAAYVAAYRIGMLVSTAGALFLVSYFQSFGIGTQAAWHWGYSAMAISGADRHRHRR